MDMAEVDPKGLVRESYAIEGITSEDCRSIFVDWALSLANGLSVPDAVKMLLARYALDQPEHPMNVVLRDGLLEPEPPRRKGGRAARVGWPDPA